jgi:U4/U6.U5 tri-snRNP-associated protein 1
MLEEQEKELESDLFAQQEGRAVSLEPSRADVTASDFLTVEEDRKVQRESRKKKEEKDGKFRKKKKSKKDKKKDPRRRRALESDEEEEEKREVPAKGLLQELEETAVQAPVSRKRRRMDGESAPIVTSSADETLPMDIDGDKQVKRQRFDEIMAKGNERSRQAFLGRAKTAKAADLDEDEPDDAFLSAAVEKARRLNRLKEISSKKATGADAVVAAVQRSAATEQPGSSSTAGTVTFSVDETREFTRALLARSEQAERESARKKVASQEPVPAFRGSADNVASEPEVETVAKDEEPEEEVDIHELAKQVKEEDIVGLDSTGSDVPVGRGVGSVLSLLKQTGEMSRKNAGKEEMRGRAKDERTYEDYEPLDLSKVVKIDERRATEKDKELAHREVKLEYRDKHGRLLTRKEAFRELSYQFHGYGSGKRKEEKKLQQIAREQALARQAAAGEGAGTFGALKATQKATGKAFVVHKT